MRDVPRLRGHQALQPALRGVPPRLPGPEVHAVPDVPREGGPGVHALVQRPVPYRRAGCDGAGVHGPDPDPDVHGHLGDLGDVLPPGALQRRRADRRHRWRHSRHFLRARQRHVGGQGQGQ